MAKKEQGDALDELMSEGEQAEAATEETQAADTPTQDASTDASKSQEAENVQAEEEEATIMLIHPQLGTEVPVKQSLVESFLEQGFKY